MTTTEPGTTPTAAKSPPARRAIAGRLVLVGLLLVSITMRGPIIAVAPAIADIEQDLGIDAGTAGLLTSIPVICFGLATPLVLWLTRRSSINHSVLLAMGLLLAGILVRSGGGLALALAGTLILGIGITVANVVVPVIIGRDFPTRTTQVTGFYTAALNIGSLSATTLGAPLAGWLSWRPALLTWGLVVLVAAVVWWLAMPYTRQARTESSPRAARTDLTAPTTENPAEQPDGQSPGRPADDPQSAPGRGSSGVPQVQAGSDGVPRPTRSTPLWRRRLVVGMVAAFAGQSFGYYGVTAWLPSLLADEQSLSASQAGGSSAFFQAMALVSAFGLPVAIQRGLHLRAALLLVCACWISLPLGLTLAPGLWVLWCCLGGFAQGGGFTVIISVVMSRATDHEDARRMSAAVQGLGYTLGSLGPTVVGTVHTATDSWSAPMLVVAGMIVVMVIGGWTAIGGHRTTAASRHATPR